MSNLVSTSCRWLVIGVAFAAISEAYACSVCIAHAIGAGLQAVGAQTLHRGKTVLGITYNSFSKSQLVGSGGGGGGGGGGEAGSAPGATENHHQTEVALEVVHGLNDQWMLRANVPYVFRHLVETGSAAVNTQGLGDVTVGTTYQIKPKMGDKLLLAATFDIKLPTGKNNMKDSSGARLDEHSQIGTGTKDAVLGLVATMEAPSGGMYFAGLSGRVNGRNGNGYHYGNAMFYNLGYEHDLDTKSSATLEFNGRFAGRDRDNTGALDDNSGGHFGYLSLSYRRSLNWDMGLIATYQLPIIRRLNGTQSESGLLTIGIYTKL